MIVCVWVNICVFVYGSVCVRQGEKERQIADEGGGRDGGTSMTEKIHFLTSEALSF